MSWRCRNRNIDRRICSTVCTGIVIGRVLVPLVVLALASPIGWAASAPEGHNMALVGSNDLQGRKAYQPSIVRQGERWIAYIGHHGGSEFNALTGQTEPNGTSIVDVTNPAQPRYLHHIQGEAGTPGQDETGGAQMTRVCPGAQLPHADPAKFYLLRSFGQSAHEIWDVSDPSHPQLLSRLGGFRDTHKSWWECDSGIAYLVAGVPGWRTNRLVHVMDLSDPAHPRFIRDFGLVGQEPDSTGPVPAALHGPISLGASANRIYLAYGPNANGILQIVDRAKLLNGPTDPTRDNLLFPQIGRLDLSPLYGAHTSFPLPPVHSKEFSHDGVGSIRDFVMLVGESTKTGCAGPRQMVLFVDVTIPDKPMVVSTYNVPEASGNFCERGGRFGSHASNESMAPIFYGKLVFISYFNAGVRVLDVRDPYHPHEVAYYIPAVTSRTQPTCSDATPKECHSVIQSNNVETDERGYIYLVDRAGTGLSVLKLSGPLQSIK
jgi:hypothetical protein